MYLQNLGLRTYNITENSKETNPWNTLTLLVAVFLAQLSGTFFLIFFVKILLDSIKKLGIYNLVISEEFTGVRLFLQMFFCIGALLYAKKEKIHTLK